MHNVTVICDLGEVPGRIDMRNEEQSADLKCAVVWLRNHLDSGHPKVRLQIVKAADAFLDRVGRPDSEQYSEFAGMISGLIENNRDSKRFAVYD
jgi:hypothetical protein